MLEWEFKKCDMRKYGESAEADEEDTEEEKGREWIGEGK